MARDHVAYAASRMFVARRAERESKLRVLRGPPGGAVARRSGASSDEEDRHGRHGRHHQQFLSGWAFHQSDSAGFSALVSGARLRAVAPDGMSIMISNSHAQTRRAPSLGLISHLHVTKPLSSRRRSGGTRPPAEPLPFRPGARCKVSRGSLTGRSHRSPAREGRQAREPRWEPTTRQAGRRRRRADPPERRRAARERR